MPTPQQPRPHTRNATRAVRELVTLTRMLRNGGRRIYSENGLTFAEYSLLRLIDAEPGINAAGLASVAMIDKSTVSRQLSGLSRRGLIERVHDPSAPRSRQLTLTPPARIALEAIGEAIDEAIGRRLDGWSDDDVTRLADLLERFNASGITPPTR